MSTVRIIQTYEFSLRIPIFDRLRVGSVRIWAISIDVSVQLKRFVLIRSIIQIPIQIQHIHMTTHKSSASIFSLVHIASDVVTSFIYSSITWEPWHSTVMQRHLEHLNEDRSSLVPSTTIADPYRGITSAKNRDKLGTFGNPKHGRDRSKRRKKASLSQQRTLNVSNRTIVEWVTWHNYMM